MIQQCPICLKRVADNMIYYHSSGVEMNLCRVCYEIKLFLDGLHLDVRIDVVERLVKTSPQGTIFSRGFDSFIN